jgi:putative phage-type endonuclease
MRTTIPKPADRAEWLDVRRPFIGASDVAALFGEHPFISAAELALEKLFGGSWVEESTAMRRGRHLEEAVASWWAEEEDLLLVEPGELYLYSDTVCATLDRVVVGTGDVVEIKTTNVYCGEPQRHWIHQVQAQLLCTGTPRAHLVVLDNTLDLKTFVIEADPDHQKAIYEAAFTFLEAIRQGEMPDVPISYKVVSELHPEVVTSSVELDDTAASWCRQLGQLQDRVAHLQADEDALKGMIGVRLGDAGEGVYGGRPVVTWRTITRRVIDAKRLRLEQPEIATTYERPSKSRVLRLIRPGRNR